ncbi:MAG: hypothetical protein ACO24D_13610, partial [bacterium]
MEEQIPSSIPPQSNQPIPGQITPETLEAMKRQAREMAIAQYMAQQQQPVQRARPGRRSEGLLQRAGGRERAGGWLLRGRTGPDARR